MSSDPSPPPAPDYVGAAQATAQGNVKAAVAGQEGSMVSQGTPYGSLDYNQIGTWDDGTPKFSSDISLSPTGQQLLDSGNATSLGIAGLTSGALGTVQNTMSKPMDLSTIGDVENKSYADQMGLLEPTIQQNDKMKTDALANQGLVAGGEAYDNAMRDQGTQDNNLLLGASQQAINTAPTTLSMATGLYNQPLNELNALRSGSQVTNPTFGNAPGQQTTTGANLSGAASSAGTYMQGLYNQQVGQANANTAAAGQVAGAGLGAYAAFLAAA